MSHCRYCQREIADSVGVCPYPDCGRSLAVPGSPLAQAGPRREA